MIRATAVAAAAAVLLIGPSVAAGGGTAKVKLRDDVFSPTSLTVAKNSKVKFVWKGSDEHDVTVKSGPKSFQAPLQDSGTFTHKFKKSGTYQLLCSVHAPDMAMTVIVR